MLAANLADAERDFIERNRPPPLRADFVRAQHLPVNGEEDDGAHPIFSPPLAGEVSTSTKCEVNGGGRGFSSRKLGSRSGTLAASAGCALSRLGLGRSVTKAEGLVTTMIRAFGILSVCFALAACSEEPGWQDTSGKGRSANAAAADQDACFRSEAKALTGDATDAEQQKVVDRVRACMKQRGWEFSN